jgi:hypothetical protein
LLQVFFFESESLLQAVGTCIQCTIAVSRISKSLRKIQAC